MMTLVKKILAGATISALGAGLLAAAPAYANESGNLQIDSFSSASPTLFEDNAYSLQQFSSTSIEEIERELKYLETLSDEEIASLFNVEGTQLRVAPLVIKAYS